MLWHRCLFYLMRHSWKDLCNVAVHICNFIFGVCKEFDIVQLLCIFSTNWKSSCHFAAMFTAITNSLLQLHWYNG